MEEQEMPNKEKETTQYLDIPEQRDPFSFDFDIGEVFNFEILDFNF